MIRLVNRSDSVKTQLTIADIPLRAARGVVKTASRVWIRTDLLGAIRLSKVRCLRYLRSCAHETVRIRFNSDDSVCLDLPN